MRALLDTNLILDLFLGREGAEFTGVILDSVDDGKISGFISWHSITDAYHVFKKDEGVKQDVPVAQDRNDLARDKLADLLSRLSIPATGDKDFETALSFDCKDFEDSLIIAAAACCDAQYIVTRDEKHFKNSPIPPILPRDFCQQVAALY